MVKADLYVVMRAEGYGNRIDSGLLKVNYHDGRIRLKSQITTTILDDNNELLICRLGFFTK